MPGCQNDAAARPGPFEKTNAALASVKAQTDAPVEFGLILGSGLGHVTAAIAIDASIPYSSIEGFPTVTVPGHAGRLLIGRWAGRSVAALDGRVHLYEGYSPAEVALPVYLLRGLGAQSLIVTNAAGGLNPEFATGDVMLIDDQLNFTGHNPLTGTNDERLGPRFPDMSAPFDAAHRRAFAQSALALGIDIRRGVYAGVAGPSLESSAERRFFRQAGADAIGMSSVLEVIAAVHCGLAVLGISAITNAATGGPNQQADTIEAVLANAALAGDKIAAVLESMFCRNEK